MIRCQRCANLGVESEATHLIHYRVRPVHDLPGTVRSVYLCRQDAVTMISSPDLISWESLA